MKKKSFLIVLGPDRPGIVRNISKILADANCNIEDMEMSLLDGFFCMALAFNAGSQKSITLVKRNIQVYAKKYKLSIHYYPFVEKSAPEKRRRNELKKYIISGIGLDQTGIVYALAHVAWSCKLNITDLSTELHAVSESRQYYSFLLEAEALKGFSMTRLKGEVKQLMKNKKVDVQVKPVRSIIL